MSGERMRVAAASAFLRGRPDDSAEALTELIHGEDVAVSFKRADWAEVRNLSDSYQGFIRTQALIDDDAEQTHQIVALRSIIYPEPNVKAPPLAQLSFLSRLRPCAERHGFAELADRGGWIYAGHIAPVGPVETDYARTALRFLEVPYLWGGRTSLGLDCSALVQLSLAAAGIAAPRDSAPQRQALGQRVLGDAPPRRGDLAFWPGHVGIMLDGETLVHANGYHMAVAAELLSAANIRIGSLPEIRRL